MALIIVRNDIYAKDKKAVTDLTASSCTKINQDAKDMPDMYYQGFGSKLNVESCGRFPLNLTYKFVKCFD